MKSLARIRKRLHRCYELAARAMINEPGAEDLILVHGTYLGEARLGHAWIETPDGRAYDPKDHAYRPTASYYAEKQAAPIRRFTQREMALIISATGVWGPWTDDEIEGALAGDGVN